MQISYTAQPKPVKPRHTAGYTIRRGGLKLYVRASHGVILALLPAVLHLHTRRVTA